MTKTVTATRTVGAKQAAAATKTVTATKTGTATKIVEYRGYEISVPASWPVYRLDDDPTRCVRYDVSAVYLGTPGASQRCPAGLVGRTQTVTLIAPAGSAAPVVSYQRAAVPGVPATSARQQGRGTVVQGGAVVQGAVIQEAQQHQLRLAAANSPASVSATYGSDPAIVEGILRSLRRDSAAEGTAPKALWQVAPRQAAPPKAAPRSAGTAHPAAPAHPTAPAHPAHPAHPTAPAHPMTTPDPPLDSPTPIATPNPEGTSTSNALSGFDACTAPSLQAMRAWRARFSAAAVYIGGANMACDYGNLSPSWIRSAEALGWSLLPIYVGYQAPCGSFSGLINPKQAAAQGRTAASNAAADAADFRLGKGAPIYFDMEAYKETNASCRTAVLTFLDAWTRQLQSLGYVSGVYSSAGSAVEDLANTSKLKGHALAQPSAMWFALWDNEKNLNGQPYLPGSLWARDRSKQYQGGHTQKVGGITLDIDSDLVASAVVRSLMCDRDALTSGGDAPMNSVRTGRRVLLS